MLTNAEIKHIKSLQQKKFRTLNKVFVVEGPKLVSEFLDSPFHCTGVYGSAEWVAQKASYLTGKNIPHQVISVKELGRISGMKTPNEVLAIFSMPEHAGEISVNTSEWILVLDNIQDPGNLGTIIRTAEWFGIHQVVCSENSADIYNPKVLQASMGSAARVNVVYAPLEGFLKDTGTANIYGATMEGEDLFAVKLPPGGILVIGNESKGISGKVAKFLNRRITIPSPGGSADSLNASIATAVLCAEIARQRRLR